MSNDVVEKTQAPALPPDIQADLQSIAVIPVIPGLLEVICRSTGMGFAAVARVTEEHWVACSVLDNIGFGLKPGGELKLQTTICHDIRQSGREVVIDHVEKDPFYARHHTPAIYGFQSYISVPISRKDGRFFGTLCAIDPQPHKLDLPEVRGMFTLFADLIAFHLEVAESMTTTQESLKQAVASANLREQFIAILGHDLRNPVSAISNGAQMLQRMELEPDALRLAKVIRNSAFRISELVENILDFARGRLGDGISLRRQPIESPEVFISQVVSELQAIWPERKIETHIGPALPLNVDAARLSQLLSNLLGNALSYGNPADPVTVSALVQPDRFELSVSNTGKAIPKETLKRLFEPFSRGDVKPGQQGLGLGLYIAYQIASAHGGDIEVESNDLYTKFTFTMPLVADL